MNEIIVYLDSLNWAILPWSYSSLNEREKNLSLQALGEEIKMNIINIMQKTQSNKVSPYTIQLREGLIITITPNPKNKIWINLKEPEYGNNYNDTIELPSC